MPQIHKKIPRELTHDSSEAFLCLIAFHHYASFHSLNKCRIHLAFVNRTVCLLYTACVCLLFRPLTYHDQTFNSTTTLCLFQSLDFSFFFCCKVHPAPHLFFFSCICRSKISNFIFFVLSPQNVEVFYWCGQKQWGQGRALWWQKCIFNPCEWMAPHIPQQQALYWMAALTRLFSLLITALCLFTMDIVIYLHQLREGGV